MSFSYCITSLQTKAITSYLNMAYDSRQYHQVLKLLAFNADFNLVFFVGQSMSGSSGDSDAAVSEQDMRPNIFVLSLVHRTVQCLSCRLVTCQRLKREQQQKQQQQQQANRICLGN